MRDPLENPVLLHDLAERLEASGIFFFAVEKETTEALDTASLLRRINSKIKSRGFTKLLGNCIIAFSGWGQDEREVEQIPEVRSYWEKLYQEFPELPALLTVQPTFHHNGPGIHVMLLGQLGERVHHREIGQYDSEVTDARPIVKQAIIDVLRAGQKYHCPPTQVMVQVQRFQDRRYIKLED